MVVIPCGVVIFLFKMINYKLLDYGFNKLYLLNHNNFINHYYRNDSTNKIIKFRILRLNNQSIIIGIRLRFIYK